MIYLDHAATSWPKPKSVLRAMVGFLEKAGGNPSRSGHRLSIAAGRIIYETRESIAKLFSVPDPLKVIFTTNATASLNLVIQGILKPGDKVLTTSIEHNAVMRPLRKLEKAGIQITVIACRPDSSLDLSELERLLDADTKMVIINHASNVTGIVLPIQTIGDMVRKTNAFFVVDAAQSAGTIPIDVQQMHIDFLTFSGHKGLLGPSGTGGLVLGNRIKATDVSPIVLGGTGSKSEFEEQPEFLPDRFESGTLNGPGIAGLGAGVEEVLQKQVSSIQAYETSLAKILIEGLCNIPGIQVYGPKPEEPRTGVVSFTVQGKKVSEIGYRLDEEFEVLCRVGLHCAPAAHRTIGTFPEGTVRWAIGMNTTPKVIAKALFALQRIIRK